VLFPVAGHVVLHLLRAGELLCVHQLLMPSLQPQAAGHSAASLHCWMPCAGVPILMPDQQLNPCMVCVTADCRPITSSIFHEEEDLVKDKMQARAAQVRFVWVAAQRSDFCRAHSGYFFVLAPAQYAPLPLALADQ
jgi:hypothetical protein